MIPVQRPGTECDDSFEEKGEIEEDFASSEKLVVEIDHEYKGILDRTRGVLLEKVERLQEVAKEDAGEWFDETGTLTVENQLKGAIRNSTARRNFAGSGAKFPKFGKGSVSTLGTCPEWP